MSPDVITEQVKEITRSLALINQCLEQIRAIDWGSFGSFIVALATFATAWLARSTAIATHKQSITAEKTRTENFRPHLIIKNIIDVQLNRPYILVGGDQQPDLPFNIEVIIDNYSSQPAIDIDIFAKISQESDLTISHNTIQKIALLRPHSSEMETIRTVANRNIEGILNHLSKKTYILYEATNDMFKPKQNVKLELFIIYKNFANEIFVVESQYYLLPKTIQDAETIAQMEKDFKEKTEAEFLNTSYKVNLMATLRQSSYKEYGINAIQYEEMTKSLSQVIQGISFNE